MSENHSHSSCGCDHGHDGSSFPQGGLVAASGIFTAIGMAAGWVGLPFWLPVACFAAATLAGGLLVFPAAWRALRRRRLDINVLMTVAVTGAWLLGERLEAASVVFLFSLSEWLESWAAVRAKRSVASLLELSPETALLVAEDGSERTVPGATVEVGSIVRVRSGKRIPLDGEVTTGTSSVNQAPITGESVPVEKQPGDPVYAGSINGEGSILFRTTKAADDSTLARIIRLVADAEAQRPPSQRFVDRFAAVYTPLVFLAAVAVALVPPLVAGGGWPEWIYRSLVLLVIACPCALVISTPVGIVSGLTALARRGVLVKGGIHLEAVGKLRALAVDKTGTITRGTPRVVDIIPFSATSTDEILRRAAAIDSHSSHPLAIAVVEAAKERDLVFESAANYRSITGRGAEADLSGHPHFIGNHRMAHETGVCTPEVERRLAAIEEQGRSLAILGHAPHAGCPGEILGILAIADPLRPEVPAALKELHAAGVEKVVMLSGDNSRTAAAIAREAGIDEAIGDLMPEEKVGHVRRLVREYGHAGMIGDGVNDAPALASATVGIAMGAVGSDSAIETADIALMKDDLTKVAAAIRLGRRTLSVIRFNIAFALGIKAVFLLLALFDKTGLWMAILADTGATLLVILNALRLLRDE